MPGNDAQRRAEFSAAECRNCPFYGRRMTPPEDRRAEHAATIAGLTASGSRTRIRRRESSGKHEGVAQAQKSKRRWWELQFGGSPRLAYVLGSLILLVGLAQLINSTVERGHWWLIVMGVYFTIWGVLMLLGARASSREAKTSDSDSGSGSGLSQ